MRPPRWVLAPALVGLAFVAVPLAGVVVRAPWRRLGAVLGSSASVDAVGLSVRTALASTLLVAVLGVPLALVLASLPRRLGAPVRTVVLAPLVLPPVVSGLALLAAFGRQGLVGTTLGGHVAYTTLAVVLAQAFVSLPYLVLAVEGALRARDVRLEEMTAVLGATPTQVLRWVTLPLVRTSLVTGTVLALARALGEFGATLTFAGSLQGVTRTLPLEIYLQREIDPDAALGLSLLLLALAVGVVAAMYGPGARERTPRPARVGDVGATPRATPPVPTKEQDAGRPASVEVAASVAERGVHLDVAVPAATCTAIVGPNGSGKSTLLGLVSGRVAPSSGVVRLDGVDAAGVPAGRRGVSLVAQEGLLLPHLSVLDNVAVGPRAHGLPREAARAVAARELDRLGVGHLAPRAPATLSGGQAQRVSLARALAVSPRVLLLDEPFAALDGESAEQMRVALVEVRRRRPVTTLLVTHSADDVRALADAVVTLDGGRVVRA